MGVTQQRQRYFPDTADGAHGLCPRRRQGGGSTSTRAFWPTSPGDKRADIIGFGDDGVWVSLNSGNGTFQAPQLVFGDFGYNAGNWRVNKHPRFVAELR